MRCRGCEALQREIDYLRQLVDNLIEKLGVRPVGSTGMVEDFDKDKPELSETEEEVGDTP